MLRNLGIIQPRQHYQCLLLSRVMVQLLPSRGTTSIALTPTEDADDRENELIVLEATIAGSDATDEAIVEITDTDNSVTGVVLSLNGTDGSDADPPVAVVTVADDAGATAVTVGVSVTLEEALAEDETRTVMVAIKTGDETTAETGDYTFAPSLPVSITVTGDGTTNPITGSTSVVLTPAEDTDTNDEAIVLEASVEGQMDEAIVAITDTDTDYSVTEDGVTLNLNGVESNTPATETTFGDDIGATIVTVSVSVVFANALEEDETRTVTISVKADDTTAEAVDYTTNPTLPVEITLTGDGSAATLTGSANIVLTPAADADEDDEVIALEASIGGETDDAQLQLTDSGAATPGNVVSVTLSPAADPFEVDEGEAITTTVTVTVTVEAGAATAHDVVLTAADAADATVDIADLDLTSPVSVPIMLDATSGTAEITVTYTAAEDDDNATNEMITLTGTVWLRYGRPIGYRDTHCNG